MPGLVTDRVFSGHPGFSWVMAREHTLRPSALLLFLHAPFLWEEWTSKGLCGGGFSPATHAEDGNPMRLTGCTHEKFKADALLPRGATKPAAGENLPWGPTT